mgnify:CR=1 FL=1
MACNACHSVDGSLNRGPTLSNHYGKEIRHTDGSVVLIDDDYIRESIFQPRKLIAEGFPPIMPSYKPVLSEEDKDRSVYFSIVSGLVGYWLPSPKSKLK